MLDLAILYYSGSGHTEKLAQLIADGTESVANVQPTLVHVGRQETLDWPFLERAAGVVFGSPTYMGSIAADMKAVMDQTGGDFWVEQRWADKIAAGFTVATYPSGDKLVTLTQLAVFAAQHGMIWVGQNRIGSRAKKDGLGINDAGAWLGLMATSSPDKTRLIGDEDAETARLFGRRVAEATVRWHGG